MSNPAGERLYNLLPSVYRVRDAEHDEALRALLGVIENQLRLLEDDIGRLYDNLFIETCDEWVVPYLGDLLGVRGLRPVRDAAFSQRALVANTLGYRRRKGTVAVLEQLARDVTGWPAKAVEFFELLATTQHLDHVRPGRGGTVDLRDIARLAPVGGPFDRAAHTADLRHIDEGGGRYNVPNVGLFLWRLQPYFVARATANPLSKPSDGRYRFSPLGNDAALFNRPQTETDITQLAAEQNVPGPLRRRPLYDELEARRQALADGEAPRAVYFGAQPVLQVFADGRSVPPERIMVCDLSDPPSPIPEGWRRPAAARSYEPASGGPPRAMPIEVAVDPVLGRLAFPKGVTPEQVQVSYAYGFPGDLGGGPYERRETLAGPSRTERKQWNKTVSRHDPQASFSSLSEALAAWDDLTGGDRDDATITITDSATYTEALTIRLAEDERFVIQAANGVRPVLRCLDDRGNSVSLKVTGGHSASTSLTLNGLLIEGGIRVEQQSLRWLRIVHCTLVPGRGLDRDKRPLEPDRPSVNVAAPNNRLRMEIDRSVTGSLRLPTNMDGLEVRDSIVDSVTRSSRIIPAVVSGNLSSVSLSSETPAVNVTIGDEGPYRAIFPEDQEKPTTVPRVRDLLETAIRTAHDSPAFENARVITVPGVNRLIVLPGVAAGVTVETSGADPTADELSLDPASVRKVYASVSEPLSSFAGLSSGSPSLNFTIGDEGKRAIVLTGNPTTVVQARNSLQQAIQTAPNAPQAFTSTLVGNVDDRLVVLPGTDRVTAVFSTTPTDRTTLAELGLDSTPSESDRPAIAASEDPGPSTTLERTTLFGAVHVQELALASEVIFTDSVRAERRQTGFVRFSYVPEGSRTPRQFRCQPDLAIQRELEAASQARPSLTPAEQDRIRNRVRTRVVPSFTSVRYGEPGYAQLSWTCAGQILTGAEDENEMGAFNFLQQAQRIQSLRVSLDEYLRLGLEAGIIPVN